MNVTVEHLSACKKLLRVEVDVPAVDAAFEAVIAEFRKHASLPGFRPGKAPRPLILRTFKEKIEAEARNKLIPDAYQKAVKEQNLRPVGHPDLEELQFGPGLPLQFTATVEVEGDFELPDYKGLPIRRDTRVVSDEDVESALVALREQRAAYKDVSRPVQRGDYVVVNYSGLCEGKPITDLVPTARGITQQKNFWMHVETGQFIPGFTDQLVGAQGGEKRTVTVTFPQEFVEAALAGKLGIYEVEVLQVKEKELPAVDDQFAKTFGAESLERLRAGVRVDLEHELSYSKKRAVRDQLVATLLGRVTCELPEAMLQAETKSVVYDIVRSNAERGIPKGAIDQHKDEIYNVASANAKERVKARMVLGRIAEKEGIQATQEELTQRILHLARQQDIKPDKMVKQLQEGGGLAHLQEQIISAKVLDFLEANAQILDVPGSA